MRTEKVKVGFIYMLYFSKGKKVIWASQVVLVVKNLLANAGDFRDTGSILESGRSPERGHGKPLQYSARIPVREEPVCYSPKGCKESDTTEAT